MINFIKNENIKILKRGEFKNKSFCLIAVSSDTQEQYIILLNSNRNSGDGYLYDSLEEAQKDFTLLLHGESLEKKVGMDII